MHIRDYAPPNSFPFCSGLYWKEDVPFFQIIQVGGHKSQREDWKQYYGRASAVIFVASLSCYDEWMIEDRNKNKMTDQLELFREIVNEKQLKNVPIILLFTKKDLFMKKFIFEKVPLSVCPSFTFAMEPVPVDSESAFGYVRNRFFSLRTSRRTATGCVKKAVNTLDQEEIHKVWIKLWPHVMGGKAAEDVRSYTEFVV